MSTSDRKVQRDVRFRATVPSNFDDGLPIPSEWELHCPKCNYDLTGLTQRRCPECGRSFKPHDVWAQQRIRERTFILQTPAYIPYALLTFLLLVLYQWIAVRPIVLLPMVVLPMYEMAAAVFKWEAHATRSILAALAAIGTIVWMTV